MIAPDTIDPDENEIKLIPSGDMLVEVAYPDDEIAHSWGMLGGPEHTGRATVKCTYCIRNGDQTRYPAHEVMVIRHWKANTPNELGAGWWAWYCPTHFAATAPWASSLLAPTHLIPADLETRIGADREAAARAEAREFGERERCIALARQIPAGRWTTFGDIGKVVFGNTRSAVAVGSSLASLSTSERFNSRVRMADGTCAASGRKLAQAEETALLDSWNSMAREDGLPVVSRTGVAFAAYRLSLEELAELVKLVD